MERERILQDAVRTFGEDSQMLMMIEEMSELTQAICKYRRANDDASEKDAWDNIREEMADVQIMLDQMKIMFSDVQDIDRMKMERLEKRLQAANGS